MSRFSVARQGKRIKKSRPPKETDMGSVICLKHSQYCFQMVPASTQPFFPLNTREPDY